MGDFNSIKVRLEQDIVDYKSNFCDDFNSIKVRLEHAIYVCSYLLSIFQFHKGTIRT